MSVRRSAPRGLKPAIAKLATLYPSPKPMSDPLALIVWENIGYLIDDARRAELFEEFRERVGIDADKIMRAPGSVLLDIAKRGGMNPGTRVSRLKNIAAIVLESGELPAALDLAAKYDRKLVVEEGVGGRKRRGEAPSKARELEVGVLGNDDPKASVVGEIIPGKEFYDYEAKYLSEGSVPVIPAKLTKAESKQIREMAVAAFRACDLSGLARVDFLMEPGGKRRIYLNEVNTMPGFTQISMYPKLWQATGVGYKELITHLIELALERQAEKNRTTYSRN